MEDNQWDLSFLKGKSKLVAGIVVWSMIVSGISYYAGVWTEIGRWQPDFYDHNRNSYGVRCVPDGVGSTSCYLVTLYIQHNQ